MNIELKEAEEKLEKLLVTLSPSLKTILIGYFLALEENEHDLMTTQVDTVMLRRSQGKALAFKALIKKFTA